MGGKANLTLEDVVAAVEREGSLSIQTKRDLMSAVRKVANLISPDGLHLPAEPGAIAVRLRGLSPAMAGVEKPALANMKSRVRRALKIAGVDVEPGKHDNPLSPEWSALRQMSDKKRWRSLSRLAHVASANGWKPADIADDHMQRFRDDILHRAIHDRPLDAFYRTCKTWNDCATNIAGWPGKPVTVPSRRSPYTLAWNAFPKALVQEVDAHFDRLANPPIFVHGPPQEQNARFKKRGRRRRRALAPRTVQLKKFQLLQYLSALVQKGLVPETMTSLEVVTAPPLVDQGLTFFHERAGNRMAVQIDAIAQVVAGVARHWLKNDARAEEISLMLPEEDKRAPRMSEKVKELLRQFDDPRNRAALLDLPNRLAKDARRTKSKRVVEAARLFESALAIEFFIQCPIRIGNLVSLDIDKHLKRSRPGADGLVHLVIPAEEVKNDQPLEFEVPEPLERLYHEHLNDFRPHLPGASSRWLFARADGGHEVYRNLSGRLSAIIRRRTGIRMTAHMFRHFAAEMFLERNPTGHHVMTDTLGHKDAQTASRYYVRRNMARAARLHSQNVLKVREEARQRVRRRRRTATREEDLL